MAAATMSKIRKIVISPLWIDQNDEIWHSDATQPSALHMPIKIENFKNPR